MSGSNFNGPYDPTWSNDDEGSGGSPFMADYYRQADDVCRGVTLGEDPTGGSGGDYGYTGLTADYYNVDPSANFVEPDTLDLGGPDLLAGGLFGLGKGKGKVDEAPYSMMLDDDVKRFDASMAPPDIPSHSKFFELEPTTLHLQLNQKFAPSPSHLGNALLDLLEKEVKASITKVNHKKFAVKANIFMEHQMCSLKARLYKEEGSGNFALEFQKRSGNSLSFQAFFQKATAVFKERSYLDPTREPPTRSGPPMMVVPPPLDFDSMDCDFGDFSFDDPMIQPLIDMAGFTEMPTCQAEAAAGLADAINDQQTGAKAAEVLCQEFDKVKQLVDCKLEAAGYQTARLVEALMKHEYATSFLLGEDFVRQMTDKVTSDESKLVRMEFRKAIDILNQKYPSKLPQPAKDLLASMDARQATAMDKLGAAAAHGMGFGKAYNVDFVPAPMPAGLQRA
mmetsp:Transcript_144064/g.461166  ORF Transcript_144064/g.461166 Transcript_144064/m.461166 type:complete len:450 (-) Transcript_144064:116-1465(-)